MSKYNYSNWHEIKDLATIYSAPEWDSAKVCVWNPRTQKNYDLMFCGSTRPHDSQVGQIQFIITPQKDDSKHEGVYFISGHRDITEEEFDKYYKHKILEVLTRDRDAKFIVGDYEGVDIMAQNLLVKLKRAHNVTVCHMFDSPRNIHPEIAEYGTVIGGFESDEERDAYMTYNSCEDIAYVRPGKRKSGTAQNIVRRFEMID